MEIQQKTLNFAGIFRQNLPEFKIPKHPGRIRTHPDASGIGTSSALSSAFGHARPSLKSAFLAPLGRAAGRSTGDVGILAGKEALTPSNRDPNTPVKKVGEYDHLFNQKATI